jgi:cell division septal protein FtsQ
MAGSKTRSKAGSPAGNTQKDKERIRTLRKKWVRVIFVLFLIVALIAGILTLLWLAANAFFFKNEHFVLREVVVESPDWWNGKSDKVIDILDLKLGRDNLFTINLNEARKKLKSVPSIEKVSLHRSLPDRLVVRIIGRIPRAFLYNSRSKWVVNASGIVMSRNNCISLDRNLPVVYGFALKKTIDEGAVIKEIEPALELIMCAVTYYPEIRIVTVNVKDPDYISSILFFGDMKRPYKVYFPRTRHKYMLNALQHAIEKARRTGESRSVITLTYRGQAIFR